MKTSILILFVFISSTLFAQKDCNDYPKNYVPIDLTDALNYLDCIWNDSLKTDFKKLPERVAVNDYYRNYRVGISERWGLVNGNTDIYNYFQNLGIFNPDDMSHIILTSFHRYLNGKDLEFEKTVKRYIILRKRKEAEERKLRETLFSGFEVNDTVCFKYNLGFVSREQRSSFYNDSCDAKGVLLEKNLSNLQLKIRLLESCDSLGVIIAIEDVYEKKDLKVVLTEKGKKFYMKENDVKWTYFDLWQKNE